METNTLTDQKTDQTPFTPMRDDASVGAAEDCDVDASLDYDVENPLAAKNDREALIEKECNSATPSAQGRDSDTNEVEKHAISNKMNEQSSEKETAETTAILSENVKLPKELLNEIQRQLPPEDVTAGKTKGSRGKRCVNSRYARNDEKHLPPGKDSNISVLQTELEKHLEQRLEEKMAELQNQEKQKRVDMENRMQKLLQQELAELKRDARMEFANYKQRTARLEYLTRKQDRRFYYLEQLIKKIKKRTKHLETYDQDKENMYLFPRDTYSFLSLYGPMQNPFIFSISFLVFLFQFGLQVSMILSIVVSPLRSNDDAIDSTHPIFPGGVEPIVVAVQIIAIIVHVIFPDYSMQDLIIAYNQLWRQGQSWKLKFSAFLRFVQGATASAATFLLIFTSLTVMEVILNFAAINFISSLDDVAFESAIQGYFGQSMWEKALTVKDERLNQRQPDKASYLKHREQQTRVVMIFVFVIMFIAGMIFVVVPQSQGSFLIEKFRIEFEEGSKLEPYSGCYNTEADPLKHPLYRLHVSETATFGYCKQEERWYLFDSSETGYEDACEAANKMGNGTLAYSSRAHSFDIRAVFADPWFSRGHTPLGVNFYLKGDGIKGGCGKSIGDGKCDMELNTEEFNYDRGDCCAATCAHPFCGLNAIKSIAFATNVSISGDGYQHCKDPSMAEIEIFVKDIIPKTYRLEGDSNLYNTLPPVLLVECDGMNHLMLNLEREMKNKTEVVKVRNGALCKVRVGNEIKYDRVEYEVYHTVARGKQDIIIAQGLTNVEGYKPSEFRVIPHCYFDKLKDHIDIDTIYIKERTPQRMVIVDWLLVNGIETINSECQNPFFVERYALAVAYISAKVNAAFWSDETTSSIRDAFPEEMISHDAQCSWSFVTCAGGHILQLSLYKRSFEGTLATELALLSKLASLDFDNNELKGTIPSQLGTMINLEDLSFYNNMLTGSIPTQFGNLVNLKQFWTPWNTLRGSIPNQLGNLKRLEHLELHNNTFTGNLPTQLGNLTNLKQFTIANNKLTGSIPTQFGNLVKLTYLDLYENSLTGSIPTQFGNLVELAYLDLDENSLTGSILTQLGNLVKLTDLYLSNNALTGSIPTQLGNLTNLEEIWLHNNNLTGSVDFIFCIELKLEYKYIDILVDSWKVNCSCCRSQLKSVQME